MTGVQTCALPILPNGPHHWLVASIGFAIAAASTIGTLRFVDKLSGRIGAIAPASTSYGLALGFIGLLTAQVRIPFGSLLACAIVTLALVVATIYWAMRTDNRTALLIGYAAFSAEVLSDRKSVV